MKIVVEKLAVKDQQFTYKTKKINDLHMGTPTAKPGARPKIFFEILF